MAVIPFVYSFQLFRMLKNLPKEQGGWSVARSSDQTTTPAPTKAAAATAARGLKLRDLRAPQAAEARTGGSVVSL
jgi:hypothetical protein